VRGGKPPGGGGKGGKEVKQCVYVELKERGRRKHVTVVSGLDTFGVKLKEAASALGKKFGAGASVTKSATGLQEIDVQGDVVYDLPEVLAALFDIPEEAIVVKD
jgi:density-regulated protein DRP1